MSTNVGSMSIQLNAALRWCLESKPTTGSTPQRLFQSVRAVLCNTSNELFFVAERASWERNELRERDCFTLKLVSNNMMWPALEMSPVESWMVDRRMLKLACQRSRTSVKHISVSGDAMSVRSKQFERVCFNRTPISLPSVNNWIVACAVCYGRAGKHRRTSRGAPILALTTSILARDTPNGAILASAQSTMPKKTISLHLPRHYSREH